MPLELWAGPECTVNRVGDQFHDQLEASGFTLSRLDPLDGDHVTIAISTARSPALFKWLGVLDNEGIIVDKLTLRPNSDATLAVEGVLRVRGR